MLDVIDHEYADVVTLRTLSSLVGRQPAYLGRLFRQEVGATAHDYLTRVRLDHAATLIRDGMKIEAVALSVGYRSKKNFYQQFRKRFGTTPVLYRNNGHGDADRPAVPAPSHSERDRSLTTDVATIAPGTMATIIRASNRAWRLATRAQRIMVEHFDRFRMPMLLTDGEGRYVGANQAALSVTGYSAAELRELRPSALFVESPASEVRCVWQLLVLRHDVDQPSNATLRTKTGQAIGVQLIVLRNVFWGHAGLSTLVNEDAVVREPRTEDYKDQELPA